MSRKRRIGDFRAAKAVITNKLGELIYNKRNEDNIDQSNDSPTKDVNNPSFIK